MGIKSKKKERIIDCNNVKHSCIYMNQYNDRYFKKESSFFSSSGEKVCIYSGFSPFDKNLSCMLKRWAVFEFNSSDKPFH